MPPAPHADAAALNEALGLPLDTPVEAAHAARSEVLAYVDAAPDSLAAWASVARERLLSPATPNAATRRAQRLNRILGAALALVAGIGLVVGVYYLGDPARPGDAASPHGSMGIPTAPAAPLDEAKVAELKAKLAASPNDVATLTQLGAVYFKAERYVEASEQYQKVVTIEPRNLDARLTLGVCYFNTADYNGAEEQWLRAVEIDPKSAHPHYNLGFLYMAKQPAALDQAKLHWDKVIELDPTSDIAKNARDHLGRLSSASAAPTAEPTK